MWTFRQQPRKPPAAEALDIVAFARGRLGFEPDPRQAEVLVSEAKRGILNCTRQWLMSTPHGKRGFFYEVWEHGGKEWARVSVAATECARIPKEFLEEERAELGAMWFQQEYLCEFVDSGGAVFGRDLVDGGLDGDVWVW